ncbi:MAG: hypothetical protein IPL12_12605 [Bacteroidetes bacterium]|nr:hypothetical protein [Bacteroidota bacterium]
MDLLYQGVMEGLECCKYEESINGMFPGTSPDWTFEANLSIVDDESENCLIFKSWNNNTNVVVCCYITS